MPVPVLGRLKTIAVRVLFGPEQERRRDREKRAWLWQVVRDGFPDAVKHLFYSASPVTVLVRRALIIHTALVVLLFVLALTTSSPMISVFSLLPAIPVGALLSSGIAVVLLGFIAIRIGKVPDKMMGHVATSWGRSVGAIVGLGMIPLYGVAMFLSVLENFLHG